MDKTREETVHKISPKDAERLNDFFKRFLEQQVEEAKKLREQNKKADGGLIEQAYPATSALDNFYRDVGTRLIKEYRGRALYGSGGSVDRDAEIGMHMFIVTMSPKGPDDAFAVEQSREWLEKNLTDEEKKRYVYPR